MPDSTHPPHALYCREKIRLIEAQALRQCPPGTLMERAGETVARLAQTLLGAQHGETRNRILILVGPGNNGGDACVTAHLLLEAGYAVSIILCAEPERFPHDAGAAWTRLQSMSPMLHTLADFASAFETEPAAIIDGLFGIGLCRPIDGKIAELVSAVNRSACPVIAIDVPSGLDTDTGRVIGDNLGCAIRATHTVTFIADKIGLHTGQARDHVGILQLELLGIEQGPTAAPDASLTSPTLFAHCLQVRLHDTHKGSNGDLSLYGGDQGMCGALILAARSALHCGAGRVFAGFLDQHPAYDDQHPELMLRDAATLDPTASHVVIGPGLGQSSRAAGLLARALNTPLGLVIDADALNLIAINPALKDMLAARAQPAIITPHPLEAARLLHSVTAQVQRDRVLAARTLARQLGAIVVLKGSGTVIASPEGKIAINPTGGPALATAGTGDVLAGACGALLAQAWPAWDAAVAAVFWHGSAGDRWSHEHGGTIGMTASELPPLLRACINDTMRDFGRRGRV